ncbi:MAG: hypothetical protein Q4Q62_08765, partial [Thermoplasmata archaeon]|nr:hypothetical protein [Thermoplasmata archaeon]
MNSKCRTLVVAHGKSEIELCMRIAALAHVDVEFVSSNGGENTICLLMLNRMFSEAPFTSDYALHQAYPNLEYRGRAKDSLPGLEIFTIMDIDGDTANKKSYMTGNMFAGCHFAKRIHPIYSDDNLDQVMMDIGYGDVKVKKIHTYFNICHEIRDLKDLHQRLVACERTNLDEFVL